MSSEFTCKFHRRGHCKFGEKCVHSHQIETCQDFPCHDETCDKRHPPICKFFMRFGRCKFNFNCSYLHKILLFEDTNIEIKNISMEVNALKARNEILHSTVVQLQNDLNQLLENTRSNTGDAAQKKIDLENYFYCNICSETFKSELELKMHMDITHKCFDVFKCESCDFVSKSQRGVNIHKSTVHKTLSEKRTTTPEPPQIPINCIRHADGCPNLIHSYFNRYTAICDSCLVYMDQKLKSTPFSHQLCPCCHQQTDGIPLSLCSECLEDVYSEEGYAESRWGAWHLDKKSKKIVCIYLDFN